LDWLEHPAYIPIRSRLISRLQKRVFHFKRLRPLVFLCGKANSPNRNTLRTYLNKQHPDLFVFYAEQIWEHISVRQELNALQMEDQLARLADLVIILVESPGTYTELGAFSLNPELRRKLLAVLDLEFKNSRSFINSGPVAWINNDSRYGTLFADFNTILAHAKEIDENLGKIPRRGRLEKSEQIRGLHEKPKHLLFLICDLLAVIGPATKDHCEYYLEKILEEKPLWSVASLLGLGVSLNLISEITHPEYSLLYSRPLSNGKLESFQHQEMFNLSLERARFLSVFQNIPAVQKVLSEGQLRSSNA